MNSTRHRCAAPFPSFSLVRRCTTTQGPACSTVQPTSAPSSAKICVMPSLIPIIPSTAIFLSSLFRSLPCFRYWLRLAQDVPARPERSRKLLLLRCSVAEPLDFHVHTRRQIEFHQCVDRVRCGLENVDEPLVRAHLELLASLLVHVRRTQHRPAVDGGRQRNRAGHISASTFGGLHDFPGGLIQNPVIVSF